MKELKVLVGKKVLGISKGRIYFDGGFSLEFSEYEAYISEYQKETIKETELIYYSPKILK